MPFGTLWLPVVVATVAVFIASSFVHMALKYHKADYKKLPQEDAVAEALRKAAPAPGLYVLPYVEDMKLMKDPAVQERFKKGPVALLTFRASGTPNMGKYLGQWFVYCFVVSFVTAYIARHSLSASTPPMTVLRITAAVSFMAYGVGELSNSIWRGQPWANTARALVDALIYSVVTGAAFMWRWPAP
jgi:hypothetical protein